MNRLRLDFSINTTEDRMDFLQDYLAQDEFLKKPLTNEECETCANYILWGKDPTSGKNVVQEKSIQIETRHKTWDSHQDESLEGLLENPGFSETMLQPPETPPLKVPKQNFSRKAARESAPPSVLERLEDLWNQIDELDLLINYYELQKNKRKLPPREALLARFAPEKQLFLQEVAAHLTQFKYLKMRHLLVELRREQFTLRDSYSPTIMSHNIRPVENYYPITLGEDLKCAPLGLKPTSPLGLKLFPLNRFPIPDDFTPGELETISKDYWRNVDECKAAAKKFDFRKTNHIYQTFLLIDSFKDAFIESNFYSTNKQFMDTLFFYVVRAPLRPAYRRILDLKLRQTKNAEIAAIINKEFGKHYTDNYISTIFTQKIIPTICATASLHEEMIQNLAHPENFKVCKTCKETKLLTPQNFVRKGRSADGYSTQCKLCDKEKRQAKQEKSKEEI